MLMEKRIYSSDHVSLEGVAVYDNASQHKRPLVIVIHDWSGRNAFAEDKAQQLAALGYVGFALDMYGEGRMGKTNEEKSALMSPLLEDRDVLRERLHAALAEAKKVPVVDSQKIGVIGFCFGGLCALDFARSGAAISGVVSFHGLLHAPENIPNKHITAKILALHGFDDPMVTPQHVMDFGHEMTQAKADWQLHVYGNTKHAFTNPLANDAAFGTVYDKNADRRSWVAMKNFFGEVFN
jgi:dienelactone hydrolase